MCESKSIFVQISSAKQMSVNKVILVGNVGKDPETRYLDEATAISKFPLATSETYKNRSGERVSTTEWHNIVLWRGLAQVAEKYVKKGTQLYIEGRIKTRSYDDADGNRKYITEIVGDQMQLLGRRPDEQDVDGQFASGGQDRQSAAGGNGGQAAQGGQSTAASREGQSERDSKDQGFSSPDDDPFDGAGEGPDDLPF
jgi:single-strand DNA-binding protein